MSLIRHAQAEEGGSEGDHGRCLSPRGRRDVVAVARNLRERKFEAERIVSSTARRAMQTSRILAHDLEWEPGLIEASEELYLAEPAELISRVRNCDAEIRHLVLVGHNPGLSQAWGWLTGRASLALPTCGVVLLEIGVEHWARLESGVAKQVDFIEPAALVG